MPQGCVLLADSHPHVLEGLRSLLATVFETVVMVADAPSLLRAAATLQPELAVVDLSLPLSEEAGVARRLTQRHPGLTLILLSVHDDPTVAEASLATGAAGFVLKRAAVTDLLPAIQAVRQGRTYVSPAVAGRPGEPAGGGVPQETVS